MGRSLMVSLVFFAIFVAGIVTGGFLMARWARNHQARWQRMNQPQQQGIVVPLGPPVVRQMLNQLDLNRDQRKAINKILLEDTDTLRILRRETDFAIDRMEDDIDKILTPDQRVKLGKLKDGQRVRLLEQREAVQNFLRQRRHDEAAPVAPAAPASGGNEQPPPPAAATQTQPAPAPVATQTQPAPAP
jgi:Spy/CpxP family protein refolding chaperone